MPFDVVLLPGAVRDIDREFRRLEILAKDFEVASGYPEAWYERVEAALTSLQAMPERCGLAPEAVRFRRPIRHLLLPDHYRIIFEIHPQRGVVLVLHIQHQRKRWPDSQR